MKSEKARQELEDGSWKVEVGYEGEDVDLPYHAVRVDVAQYAVELAEQEAEERMREKAKRAFECVWNATPKQVAEECGAGLVAYTITHHTRQSAIGLPLISKNEYGGKAYSVTEYTMSEIIASVYKKIA